jgi:uncharacterized protein (DUF1697 family)
MRIALLRGVNVGPHKAVAMADLKAMMDGLGLAGARTLLRSGNLVFDGGARSPAELEALLEQQMQSLLSLKTQAYVRTAAEWDEAIAANPFPAEAGADPAHLLLVAFKEAPAPEAVARLQAAIPGRERIQAEGRHAFVVYPDGVAGASLTPALWSRCLPPGTGRNWNTVLKLQAMARDQACSPSTSSR